MESPKTKSPVSSPLTLASPKIGTPMASMTETEEATSIIDKIISLDEDKEPNRPLRSPSPEAMKCAICLGDLVNKSYSSNCSHEFCFACLLEWSKVKPECPLCKCEFRSIIHNIRSNSDYDEYHVPIQEPAPHGIYYETRDPRAMSPEIMSMRGRVDFGHSYHLFPRRHEVDHRYSLLGRGVRNDMSTVASSSRDQRMIRILELGPMSEGVVLDAFIRPERIESTRYSSVNENPFFNEPEETFGTSINLANSFFPSSTYRSTSPESRELAGYQKRRRIYDRGQWVVPFNSTLQAGSVLFPSIEYIRTHPSVQHRVGPWLYRELQVLLGLNRSRSELGFLYDFIMSILTRFDIRSREFRELIHSYFGSKVKHFQHELYHFILSGMKTDEYDNTAAYHNNSASTSTSRSPYVPPSVVTISDDEEIPATNNSENRNTNTVPNDDDIILLDDIEEVLNVNVVEGSNTNDEISIVADHVGEVSRRNALNRRQSFSPLFSEQLPLNLTMGSSAQNDINLDDLSRDNPGLSSWLSYHSRWDDHEELAGRPLSIRDFPVLNMRGRSEDPGEGHVVRDRGINRYFASPLSDRMQIGGGMPSNPFPNQCRFMHTSTRLPSRTRENLPSQTERRARSPVSEDEGCVLLGIHPVVKKPPLAVITLSSDDDEAGPSTSTQNVSITQENKTEEFKNERTRNVPAEVERDTFLESAWSDCPTHGETSASACANCVFESLRPSRDMRSREESRTSSDETFIQPKLMSVIQKPLTARKRAQEARRNSSTSSSSSERPISTRLQEAKRKKRKSKAKECRRKSKKKDKSKEKNEGLKKTKDKKKKEKKRKRILKIFSSTSSESEPERFSSPESDLESSNSDQPPSKVRCTNSL